MSLSMDRRSIRVHFDGGNRFQLAGIVETPVEKPIARALFAHCFTCGKDLKMIVRLSRMLAEQGIQVLRFDMTGIGSSRGDFADTNFTTNIADLLAAHRYMVAEYGRPQLLIGHSFGGAASLAVAEEIEDVIGIVTIAAPSDTYHLATVLSAMNPAIEQHGEGDVVIGGRRFTVREQMLDDFRSFDLAHRIDTIVKPMLVFHSPVDETVAYQHAVRIVTGTPHQERQRSLIALPGSDHLLTNHPADVPFVASMIAAWVPRLLEGFGNKQDAGAG